MKEHKILGSGTLIKGSSSGGDHLAVVECATQHGGCDDGEC